MRRGKCWRACRSRICIFVYAQTGAGNRQTANDFFEGAPELAVEVCLTSTEVDFGPKLRLDQRAAVREYITIELLRKRIVWRILRDKSYSALEPDPDGIYRSITFPGLWLDRDAFWRNDSARRMDTLHAGLATTEHQEFAARLPP
jgi:Uma2 family endonuclease